MTHPELATEQGHVDHAYQRLEDMRETASGMLRDAFGERGGTMQSVTERDIRVRSSLSRLEQLSIGGESLVFGRIDKFEEADGAHPEASTSTDALPGTEAFHIGRIAISDTDQEPLVVDWRAPIAEPFYRATGAEPMGLRRRRHLLTRGRQVVDLEDEYFSAEGVEPGDELGLAGPQVLLASLNRGRTGRMRDIVATVQREQDEIIRGGLPGLLVVQGGPGTGKTAVALHRAAYLLYTHRFPLERQRVLVVGPNNVFLRYIEHVLPSLGESGVEMSSISGLFGDVEVRAGESDEAAKIKGDPRMARVLARAVADRERSLPEPVTIDYGAMRLEVTPEVISRIVSVVKRRPGRHNARRRLVESLLWRHVAQEIRRRRGGRASEDEALDDEAVRELGRSLKAIPAVSELLHRIWPILSPQELLHDLFGAPPLVHLASGRLLDRHEKDLLIRPRGESLETVRWTDADIPLLDEGLALLGPNKRRRQGDEEPIATYGHIVVDEAQDLSPMQLRMIGRRSLSGSLTVVGDVGQATGVWAPAGWAEVTRHLPTGARERLVQLTVNYRTPSEVMDLAGLVLSAAAPAMLVPESVRAAGVSPRSVAVTATAGEEAAAVTAQLVHVIEEEVQCVARGNDGGTVGVISPPSLIDAVASELERTEISFGVAGKGALDAPVSLLSVTDSKGLEFDSVIVVEPARIAAESPQGLRAVYVAMTRTTTRLAVVHAEALPEPMRGMDRPIAGGLE